MWFQNRDYLACTNLQTSPSDPGQFTMQYPPLQGVRLEHEKILTRPAHQPLYSVLLRSGLPSRATPLRAPGVSLPGRRCSQGHFPPPLSGRRGSGRPAGPGPRTRPRQKGRRRPELGLREGPRPARLLAAGSRMAERARTISIASRRPAPRLPPIGCRRALGTRRSPLSRPDRAAARSGVGGEQPGVTPDVVTPRGLRAEVGGGGGAGAGRLA